MCKTLTLLTTFVLNWSPCSQDMVRLMGDASAIPPSITPKGLIPVNLALFMFTWRQLPAYQSVSPIATIGKKGFLLYS